MLGVLDLRKGLDVEETVLTWAAAAMLVASATEFRVAHDPITLRSSVWRVPLLGASALGLTALKLIAAGNPFFQIESLYPFHAKFFPRWEPRYLVYQGALGLPRASLAAMWAEGQLPEPELPGAASSPGARLMARAR